MKKIIFLTLTILSIGYSQTQFHAYEFEYGHFDTIERTKYKDTTITLNDVVVELTEADATIYTQKLQSYYFYDTLTLKFENDHLFTSCIMFIDQDEDVGKLTYWYNNVTGSRIIQIEYNNIYYKYRLR